MPADEGSVNGRLAGKRCLLTAAAAGIGRETALAFAREGAVVLATDISEAGLAALHEADPRISVQHLDVTSAQAVEALFAKEAAFDVLFNCAGYVAAGTILDCDEDDWARSFRINVDSTYRICRTAIPRMLESGGGSVINVASVASSITGVPNRFAYGATKAAVIGMTKAIAADFVARNLRCNAICPGTILTPSLQQRVAALAGRYDENLASFVGRQPMGRLGKPEEIAALAVYLGSDESGFTTGQIHVTDGGWTI